jgi:class 3 adenylate cyclase
MPKHPSGTVTFLFSDIEGSTRLWEQHPIAMKNALERHDELMRASFETEHGYIFKTMGDAWQGLLERLGGRMCRLEQQDFEKTGSALKTTLSEGGYQQEYEIGKALTLDEAVELALQK